MARYDEFKQSLKDAAAFLDETRRNLADDEACDSWRYEEVHSNLGDACSELEDAMRDVTDDIGITCDVHLLQETIDDVDHIQNRLRNAAVDHDVLDPYQIRELSRTISHMQRDIELVIHSSR